MTEEGAGEDARETWQLDELRTRNRRRYGAESTEIAGRRQCWREAQRNAGDVYGMIGWIT
jgi:hypothetical protein